MTMDGSERRLHFTLGVSPSSKLSLAADLQMVKVAILYADAATLCSLTTSMILQVAIIGELKNAERLEFLEQLLPAVADSIRTQEGRQAIQMYRDISRKKHRNAQEILYQRKLEQHISQMWDGPGGVREVVYSMTQMAGAEGIVQAFELGLLDIHIFDSSGKNVVEDFFNVVSAAVIEGTTYPLFDDSTGNLVRAGAKEGKITFSAGDVSRGKHSGLAGNLLNRLPLFEQASVAEILDIRKELNSPLVRFRAAVVRFSSGIRGAQWDSDFSTEAEQVFLQEIEPAVLEIQEAVRGNKYMTQLLGHYFDESLKALGTYGLGVFISQLASLPDIVSQALPVGMSAATIANRVNQEWKKSQRSIEQNQLYFYYRVGKDLEKPRGSKYT